MIKEMLSKLREKDFEEYTVKPMKMEDMMPMPSSKEKYPSLHLCSKDLPEIKDWEVDGEYYLVLKVVQKSKSMNTEKDGKEMYHAEFDIKEIATVEMDSENESEDKED